MFCTNQYNPIRETRSKQGKSTKRLIKNVSSPQGADKPGSFQRG